MESEDKIRLRAYEIWQETGNPNAHQNWELAKLDLWRREYYGMIGYCKHCGSIFEEELSR